MKPLLTTITVAALLISASVLTACGGGGGGGGSSSSSPVAPAANPLVGTYKSVSVRTAAGQSAACPASFLIAPTVYLECGADDTTTFNADGTYTGASGGTQTVSGTYTVSGDTVTLHEPAYGADAAFSSTFSFSVSGPQITTTQVSSTSPDPTLGSDYNGTVSIGQKQ